jgi:glycosyltransferase involved in cell wall biosynthesis
LARGELEGHQLVIVGNGSDAKYFADLHSLSAELGIPEEVGLVGGIPLEETAHFYQAAELLVYPSLNETFGLPILEAMAYGRPVVTSNVSAMRRDRWRPIMPASSSSSKPYMARTMDRVAAESTALSAPCTSSTGL